jgi:hypothetical protein
VVSGVVAVVGGTSGVSVGDGSLVGVAVCVNVAVDVARVGVSVAVARVDVSVGVGRAGVNVGLGDAVGVASTIGVGVSAGVSFGEGLRVGSGVSVSVGLGVSVAVAPSVGVGVSGGAFNARTTAVASATLTRPSALTSAPSHVLGAPKTIARTASISAVSTRWSQLASPRSGFSSCAAARVAHKPTDRSAAKTDCER